jgi:hypothetical protein
MKQSRFIVVILLASLVGCDLGEPQSSGSITTDFRLRDMNGNESNTFRSGIEFQMHLTLTNETRHIQDFTFGAPTVFFEVRIGDSLVCTSVDGLAFVQVVERGRILAGQTFSHEWRAPNSPVLPGRIVLQPGQYIARASIGYSFDNFDRLPARELTFTIMP